MNATGIMHDPVIRTCPYCGKNVCLDTYDEDTNFKMPCCNNWVWWINYDIEKDPFNGKATYDKFESYMNGVEHRELPKE